MKPWPDDPTHPGGARPADQSDLIEAAMRKDPHAVRVLWEQHRRWVAALVLAHKPREADLEDILQDVAMTFVRQIHTLKAPNALSSWLRTIALNAARQAGRKLSTRASHHRQLQFVQSHRQQPDESPDLLLAQKEEAHRLLHLALELPESYREPLLLRCMQGMTYRQISEILDLPETTIETRIARGRRMLREKAAALEQQHTSPKPAAASATQESHAAAVKRHTHKESQP